MEEQRNVQWRQNTQHIYGTKKVNLSLQHTFDMMVKIEISDTLMIIYLPQTLKSDTN